MFHAIEVRVERVQRGGLPPKTREWNSHRQDPLLRLHRMFDILYSPCPPIRLFLFQPGDLCRQVNLDLVGDVLRRVDDPSDGIDVDRVMRCAREGPLTDPERSRPGLCGATGGEGQLCRLSPGCDRPGGA